MREDFDVVQEAIGPGYEAPFVVVASTEDGTMTERDRLDVLAKWQRKIAKDPAVQAVIGPEEVAQEDRAAEGHRQRTADQQREGRPTLRTEPPRPADSSGPPTGSRRSAAASPQPPRAPGCSAKARATPKTGALQIADGLGEAIDGRPRSGRRHRRARTTAAHEGRRRPGGSPGRRRTRHDTGCGRGANALGGAKAAEDDRASLTSELASCRKTPTRALAKHAGEAAGNAPSATSKRREEVAAEAHATSRPNWSKVRNELAKGNEEIQHGTKNRTKKRRRCPKGLEKLRRASSARHGISRTPGRLGRRCSEARRGLPPLAIRCRPGSSRASVKVDRGAGARARRSTGSTRSRPASSTPATSSSRRSTARRRPTASRPAK